MLNGWTVPAVFIFVATQATAAVWWASGTHTKVEDNTTAIEKVIENEKQIAIVQVQQAEIVKDVGELNTNQKEVKRMVQDIVNTLQRWDGDD